MTPQLTHVALGVRNLEQTVSFYCKYAKMHLVHDRQERGSRVVWLGTEPRDNHFVIVAFERSSPGGGGTTASLQHLGFAVASRAEVDAVAAAARADDVLLQEPRDAGPVVGYFCLLADPDGNQVEFSFGQPITLAELESALAQRRVS